jgi:pilus assembly protein CpaE
MPNSTQPTRVLSITNSQSIWRLLQSAILKEQDFILTGGAAPTEGIFQAVEEFKPDIILLDYLYDTDNLYTMVDQLTAQNTGNYAIVVIMPAEEVHNSNSVILAGARAFMIFPFSEIDLVSTLRRVRELLARAPVPAAPSPTHLTSEPIVDSKHMFVVYSPKGGVGCTSVATNIAIALQREVREKVLLVDGKHQFGHVSVQLNLRTINSIADLIAYAGTLDKGLIKQVVTPYSGELEVLPSPTILSEGQGIRPDDLYKVILGLQDVYAHIVVDGGSYLGDNVVTYMDAASRIILLITPDLAAVRDARQFLEISQSLSYPPDKILLVLNHAGRKHQIVTEDIEQVLQTKIFASIPSDHNAMLQSINEGVPIMNKKSNHSISKAIRKLAKSLISTMPAGSSKPSGESGKISAEVLAKTSRLG